jgi:hypothetical protein
LRVESSTEPHTAGAALGRASGEARRQRRDVVRRIVTQTRRQQGLPPTVTDLEVLERVAALLENGGNDAAA